MKLTVLVDNIPNEEIGLKSEHGLSFLLQADDKNILIDVGATSLFIENSCKLGFDISQVDYLILSHAHSDHVGGLAAFLTINSKAKIYLSSNVIDRYCYSTRSGVKRDISIQHDLLQLYKERFILIDDNCSVTENVTLICDFPTSHTLPKANATLHANDLLDDFSHELAVVVKADNSNATIISPCSHRGILNIIDAVKGLKVTNFIGGLHLLDSDEKNIFESSDEIHRLANEISTKGVSLYTGHCTGRVAKNIFLKILAGYFFEFYSGFTIDI